MDSPTSLAECIQTLEEQAEPIPNDIRFSRYVTYINIFLQHFGDERIHLVGSTGDGTKLTLPKDEGDADYLIVSGKVKIPLKSIEFRTGSSTYAWIKSGDIPLDLDSKFTENGYLKAHILRDLYPELFDIARGIYLHVSANTDRIRAANESITTLGINSKVGLAHTTYREIQIHGNLQRHRKGLPKTRTQSDTDKAHDDIPSLNEEDSKILERIFELVKIAKRPGNENEFHGNFAFFAILLEEALKLKQTNTLEKPVLDEKRKYSSKPFECGSAVETHGLIDTENTNEKDSEQRTVTNAETHATGTQKDSEKKQNVDHEGCNADEDNKNTVDKEDEGVILTYNRTRNEDFVPAIRVDGKLDFMDKWKQRVTELGWPIDKTDDIYETDVFLIAREALCSSNKVLDFCLAFGLHENKLVSGFTRQQKFAYLVMKTLRKGCFDDAFVQRNMPIKLKTYHMKTAALWLFEERYENDIEIIDTEPTELTDNERILQAAVDTIAFLEAAAKVKTLKHYFTGDNLFTNFNDTEIKIVSEVCAKIREAPVASLIQSMKTNEMNSGTLRLSEEEIELLLQLESDGGRQNNVERVRKALVDIIRGINSARMKYPYNSALKQAVIETVRLIFNDEVKEARKSVVISSDSSPHTTIPTSKRNELAFGDAFKAFKTFVTKDKKHAQDNINAVVNIAEIICNMIPQAKAGVDKIGGTETIRSVLQGAANVDVDDESVDMESIIELVEKFLTAPDESKDEIVTELKVKLAFIFL